MYAKILKINPYHDSKGRFTGKGHAHSVSVGPKFKKTLEKHQAEQVESEAREFVRGYAKGTGKNLSFETDVNGVHHARDNVLGISIPVSELGFESSAQQAHKAYVASVKASPAYTQKPVFKEYDEFLSTPESFDNNYKLMDALKRAPGGADDQWAKFSHEEREQLMDYTIDSTRMNAAVTGTYNKSSDHYNTHLTEAEALKIHMDRAKTLDAVLEKTSINEDVVLHRAAHIKAFGFDKSPSSDELKALIGKEFQDHSFGSTSVDRDVAGNFLLNDGGQRVMMKINARKGKKGFYFDSDPQHTGFPHENELLLPRSSKYKVVGYKSGVLEVDLL